MKKLLVCFTILVMAAQLFCCPIVFAETTSTADTGTETTTEDGTTESTTLAEEGEQTTTADTEETTSTQEDTTSTTVTTPTETIGTTLIILDKDGKISARLTDENGYAVAGVRVYIQLGSTTLPGEDTDENGYADFRYSMPEDGTYIYCYTNVTLIGETLYAAAAASTGKAPTGTTATTEDTETSGTTVAVVPTYNRTTKVTTSRKTTKPPTWYTYTATTGMEESYISLGFSFDSGILSTFNTDEQNFVNTARLLLSTDAYAKIIGDLKGTLLMTAAASATEVTDEQITAALQNDAVLSLTDADKVERVVMDLSLQLQSTTGKVTDVWTIASDSYVIQLPIPHSMRSAKTIAVSAVTADGISEPVYATVSEDGFLRFETTSPVGTIVLLGFKGNLLAAFTGDSAVTAIVFMVLGLLCIGGAVFLYIYFFYLPKKAKKKEEKDNKDVDEETEEQPTDPFDGVPLTEGNERIDPLESPDIFTETDTDEPTSGGHHTNIDIPL